MTVSESIRRLLGEYRLPDGELDESWATTVIEKVMGCGLLEDMRWLAATFGPDRLRRYLEARGHRVLPPRELRFWSTWCAVPPALADRWVAAARERERTWRG